MAKLTQVIGLDGNLINSSLEFEFFEKNENVQKYAEAMVASYPNKVTTKWICIGDISGTTNPVGYCNGFITQRYQDAYIYIFNRNGVIYINAYTYGEWMGWKYLQPTS